MRRPSVRVMLLLQDRSDPGGQEDADLQVGEGAQGEGAQAEVHDLHGPADDRRGLHLFRGAATLHTWEMPPVNEGATLKCNFWLVLAL